MRSRAVRRPLLRQYHVEATAFLHAIVRAADLLREAQAFDGTTLRISRQAARENALKAAAVSLVELFTAPDDRRSLQVALTPAGRRALEMQRMPQFSWVFTLLKGLEPESMRSTHHVLNVIRLRLERSASERRALSAASARRSRTR